MESLTKDRPSKKDINGVTVKRYLKLRKESRAVMLRNKTLMRTNEEMAKTVQQMRESLAAAENKVNDLNAQLVQALTSKNLYQEKFCRLVSKIHSALVDSAFIGDTVSFSHESSNNRLGRRNEVITSPGSSINVPNADEDNETSRRVVLQQCRNHFSALSPVQEQTSTTAADSSINEPNTKHIRYCRAYEGEPDAAGEDEENIPITQEQPADVIIGATSTKFLKRERVEEDPVSPSPPPSVEEFTIESKETDQLYTCNGDSELRTEANGSLSLFTLEPSRSPNSSTADAPRLPITLLGNIYSDETVKVPSLEFDEESSSRGEEIYIVRARRRRALSGHFESPMIGVEPGMTQAPPPVIEETYYTVRTPNGSNEIVPSTTVNSCLQKDSNLNITSCTKVTSTPSVLKVVSCERCSASPIPGPSSLNHSLLSPSKSKETSKTNCKTKNSEDNDDFNSTRLSTLTARTPRSSPRFPTTSQKSYKLSRSYTPSSRNSSKSQAFTSGSTLQQTYESPIGRRRKGALKSYKEPPLNSKLRRGSSPPGRPK